MAKPRLSLCAIPPIANKDGDTGAGAKFYLPFYGYWSNGNVFTFPENHLPQDRTMRTGGVSHPDTFQKDCCHCSPGESLLMDYRRM